MLCVCVCESLSRVLLCDLVDCSPPGSSVHAILQARILEWVAVPFCRGSSQGSNPDLLHCRQNLYHRSHQESPQLRVSMPQVKVHMPRLRPSTERKRKKERKGFIGRDKVHAHLLSLPAPEHGSSLQRGSEGNRTSGLRVISHFSQPSTLMQELGYCHLFS